MVRCDKMLNLVAASVRGMGESCYFLRKMYLFIFNLFA